MRIQFPRGLAPGAFREGLDAGRVRRMFLAALAIGVAAFLQAATDRPPVAVTVLFYVLLALWAAATAVRHRLRAPWPYAAWTAVFVGGAVAAGLGGPRSSSAPTFLTGAGLFLLTSTVEAGAAWIAGAVVAAVVGHAAALVLSGHGAADLTPVLASAAVGGGFGLLSRLSRLDRRARRGAAERRAEKAVLEERARIARDIHDVLAHSLGGLVIQLDALEAVGVARGADEDLMTRVRGARESAADGLVAAKRAVDALRRLPAGIDAALAEIAGGVRALGTEVAVDVRAPPARVPGPVAEVLASVTIETLTNARKHAPGAPVADLLEAGRDAAVLRVTNPLPGPGSPGPALPSGGHGVPGMRERARLVGGTLDTRELDGVWSVECRVPYE
ncbi:sensor histidine kinase [Streptomyces sp. 8L]|uniref:sensor histidine kinase n=1 Tax=Streptomyces sp. 8L TaxID=2877242 RepID=UPI001CD1DE2B|nr:histidine kinase [Streptomyces sp. 8L]MCA1217048.1 histidine kinase [Streptomyces sp. 8L]